MIEEMTLILTKMEDIEIVRNNKEVVKNYLALEGADCIEERLALFTDDILYESVNTKE